ncbi:MAG: propionyl-CoA synthetase [Candidatus Puniceispirillaceae bacterium]
MSSKFDKFNAEVASDPIAFWQAQAEDVHWITPPTTILDDTNPPFYRWMTGGQINGCYNAVDVHVEQGRGDDIAIIYDSPVTGTKSTLSFAELRDRTAYLAGAMQARGIGYGDRVIIYMPMVAEAIIAMLACARIGAVHSVVFGGFSATELAKRIDDATPRLILTASCGIEPGRIVAYKPMVDEAIDIAKHKVESVILLQREQLLAKLVAGRDEDWREAVAAAEFAECVAVNSEDPAYILYTSGTTGMPKGVVRPTASHIVALKWSMRHIYDCGAGDVFWAASDVGWVVGHSYIVYAPLFAGCTTIVFEGKPVGTPDASTFWRVIAEHKVRAMFTAPTAIRAIKKEDPEGRLIEQFDMSEFAYQFVAGERCDPDTLFWLQDKLGVPVLDHWWQTETGWSMAANCAGIELLEVKAGSATKPVPSWDVQILSDAGEVLGANEIGSIVVKLPMPPGSLPTLWNNDKRFVDSYMSRFEGYYETGDAGYFDDDGYLFVMSRTDDIINVAGHRLSTGGMEEVLAGHQDVAECAVIGVNDALKGQLPLGFIVLKSGVVRKDEDIISEIIAKVRKDIGPVAAFKHVVIVSRLPKTRSGKILRATMRKIVQAEPYTLPATIDDPAILDEITDAVDAAGLIQSS